MHPEPAGGDISHRNGVETTPDTVGQMFKDLPQDYTQLVDMGNRLMDRHNYALAAECYKRALEIRGDALDVRTDYGACLFGMGLPHRAVEEFREVLKREPFHAVANFNLGIVYHNLNQPDSARPYLQEYLKLEPDGQSVSVARRLLEETGG